MYDKIIMVKEQMLQTSLVIHKLIRNKKTKFSKRWWFKYKSVKEGMKRLHIELSSKYKFEVGEWFKNGNMNMRLFVQIKHASQALLRRYDLQRKMQKLKCPKSWKFKFKSSSVECKLKCGKSWNFHDQIRLIQGELVETGRLSKLRLKKHHLLQWLWKSWCPIVLYEYFVWEHSDKWKQPLSSRLLVYYHVWYRWKARCSINIDHELEVAAYYEQLHVFDGVVVNVLLQHSTDLFIRLQSTKKHRKCPKSWMFNFRKLRKRKKKTTQPLVLIVT